MELKAVQQCRSLDGWVPVEVESSSDPGKHHVILINSWGGPRDAICECEGYEFRGECKHQIIAWNRTCRWQEIFGPEGQNDQQHHDKICPRCGGPTMWVMEVA